MLGDKPAKCSRDTKFALIDGLAVTANVGNRVILVPIN
jgi:hypothetical protein